MSNRSHFEVVTISGVTNFTTQADVAVPVRNPIALMFICTSGTNMEYSFDGITVHGRMSEDQEFTFLNRSEVYIWFRGTGSIDVHAWAMG